jgi:serine/threonine protein kinase
MGDIDDIMPEFESMYDPGSGDDTKKGDAKDTARRKFHIQISRTYPILREFSRAGMRGDTYLIDRNGLESVLKFYSADIVPDGEAIGKVKELSERLRNVVAGIYEYGYDENAKRWYAIQEYAKYGSLKDLEGLNSNPGAFNLVIKEIIEGLKTLHENNILHLNLEPSNILVRETRPFQPVFADFDMSRMIESGRGREITAFKERPLYSSPELLRGVAGPEADYWSLGMVLLELLAGRHPFGDLDGKSAADMLSQKGVPVPEQISEEYKVLLRGLLTRDPGKRWGYAEVKRWLEKDTDIPVYFSDAPEQPRKTVSKGRAAPYRFLNKEYVSLVEMLPAFLKSEEAWEAAKDHLSRGDIVKWLIGNSDENTGSQVDNIMAQSAGDPDLALISLVYTFHSNIPFIFYGKLISRKNLNIYAGRSLKNEASRGEESVIACLLNGKLTEYYREYVMLTSKEDDELTGLFEAVRKAVSRKENYQEKLNTLCKMLDILANPSAYVIPAKMSDNIIGILDFLAGNIDAVIPREKYNELIGNLIIPEEMKEGIRSALSSGVPSEYLKGLEQLRGNALLTNDEFKRLQDEHIVPVWLEGDLMGNDTSKYAAAMKLLNKLKREGLLIKKNDFLDYLRKYTQFIGQIIEQNEGAPHGLKGVTSEQRWIRVVKCDIGYEGYLRVARYVRNNVMLSMIPQIEEIRNRVSAQPVFSDSLKVVIRYLDVLRSGEVRWDNTDTQIVNEIHSLIFRKTNGPGQFFEKITDGIPRKYLEPFMKKVLGIDADERTREKEWAFAGVLGGAVIGLIAWLIIASLEPETSFYGPAALGLLLGLVRESIPVALLCAAAGFAGSFFLGLETFTEVIYAFLIAIIGTAKIGALLGKKISKVSFYDDIYIKYNGRINDVVNAAEAASG